MLKTPTEKTKSKKSLYEILRYGLLLVWFVFFVVIVKPEISQALIPLVLDLSHAQARASAGIDLDPIVLSSSGNAGRANSALYSTRYGVDSVGIYGDLVTTDTRVIAMNRFLYDYGSPMAPYASAFIEASDETGLDWRLVASISGVESGFGRIIPYNSYNGWGWRGGPGGDFSNFAGWDEAIRYVTERISIGYGNDMNPFEMEPIYCPPCGMNPQHSWANGVTRYMNQLSEYKDEV